MLPSAARCAPDLAQRFGIAAYVTFDSVAALLGVREEPQPTSVGVVITALSLVVMPSLAFAKGRVARRLGSVALEADAAESMRCTTSLPWC